MAESTEEGKEDTISQDEIDGLLAPSAKALDEKALANRVADERGVRIKELQATLATERKYAADEQAELVKDTDAELKRERSRFHWREAIASAICTATFIVGMYGIAVAVDIITTSDEETPAAIEETRRDREPAAQTPSTTQPAAKAPIKKRFGTGAK